MNVTGTGIAVGLAVVIALGFLYFGPAVFTPFAPAEPVALEQSATTTMQSFLDPNQPLPTELAMRDVVVGTGAEAAAGKQVTVNYIGMLPDGTVFDASDRHGRPFTFTLGAGEVIPGWDQGVAGMKVGGKRQLVIPPALAYGERGAGGVIPPNATLLFEVELVEVR
ncbi:MAG TPA: FKBP-type peptidyl-prolyl cis-trans isomerase [Candidatus Paceibacterota bacterium]|nr:FKBP-type peptidyl-prolyl cis-trans isomerase [Candidatus Paceibacterota bacterium]